MLSAVLDDVGVDDSFSINGLIESHCYRYRPVWFGEVHCAMRYLCEFESMIVTMALFRIRRVI